MVRRPTKGNQMAICRSCEHDLPASSFYSDKSKKLGHGTICKTCDNVRRQAWTEANREREQEKLRKWYENNSDLMKQRAKDWYEANPSQHRSHTLARLCPDRRPTPAWADFEAMDAFYLKAKALTEATGIIHEVDHIAPIQGANVCGLHTHYNLQILTKRANRAKSNTFEPMELDCGAASD